MPIDVQQVTAAELVQVCTQQVQSGKRLVTITAVDDRKTRGAYRLYYLFADEAASSFRVVLLEVAKEDLSFPSITPVTPAANWAEREVQDMFGLRASGHPDPRRLVLHENWPDGVHPLRKDFDPAQHVPKTDGVFTFDKLDRNGMNDIPVGPIHAGIIEPGHFRFQTLGEDVLRLEAQLFYTHRGLEKKLEGHMAAEALVLVEQICGVCVASHSVSFTQAVEQIAGIHVPQRVHYLRTIMLEMERLYNHIGDIGNLCAGVGFAVGNSHGMRLKERMLRLNRKFFGHRYLRGYNQVGGVKQDLSAAEIAELERSLQEVEDDVREWMQLLREHDIFNERMTGTGLLAARIARDWGVVGVAARASGVERDARIHYPHAAYRALPVEMMVEQDGDVRARWNVRMRETLHSFALVRRALAECPDGPIQVQLPSTWQGGWGLGVTESPRGENVHWVVLDEQGVIERYHIRSATFSNWAVVPFAVPGNIIADFPLINKSFELCYACCDR